MPGDATMVFNVELLRIVRPEAPSSTQIDVVSVPEKCALKSQEGDTIYWKYDGKLVDGTRFDKGTYSTVLGSGSVIKGAGDFSFYSN